jgi:hypothetical protein
MMAVEAAGVAPLLRRAQRAVRLARLSESALLGATALLLVLAATVISGGDLARPQPWGAAGLCAVLTAITWWLEKRPTSGPVAARVDRRLGLGGGLVTAFEAETGPEEAHTPLARLLSSRLLRRLSGRQVLSAALPLSLPFAALPILGAGVLALTLEGSRPAVAAPWLGEISGPLLVELGRAHGLIAGAGEGMAELSPEAALEAERLAREALAAGDTLNRALAGGEEDPARLAIPTRRLQERMAELAQHLPPESEAGLAADRARAMADAVAMALGLDAVVTPTLSSGEEGGGPSPGGERGGVTAASAAGGGAPAVDPRAVDPWAVGHGPQEDATLSSGEDTAAPAAPEVATFGRWWPEHLDGLVRRWASDDPAPAGPQKPRGATSVEDRR